MAGAEDYVEVTEGTGKKLRTRKDTVGANTVHQEVISIADPTTLTQIAGVDGSGQLKVVEASAATIAGDTTSIDGKITACNTGAVTVSGALPAGSNAIGKLAANTGVDIGDVDVTSLPSAVGKHDNTTYKTARIDNTATHTVVSAVAAKVIKVHCWNLTSQGSVTVVFKDGAAGSDISKEFKFEDREGDNSAFAPHPAYHFKTSANTLLELNYSAAITVTGTIIYSDGDAS